MIIGSHSYISIIIPTFNRKEMLRDALNSLFNQTYPKNKYEIIVVDDGSTDGTSKMLGNMKNPNLQFIRQKNLGRGPAINTGLKMAKGGIIIIIDDDCIATENYIRKLSGAYSDNKVGAAAGKIIPSSLNTFVERYTDAKGIIDQSSFQYFLFGASSSYKREVLDKIGGFDDFFSRTAEDVDISFRIMLSGFKLKYVSGAITYHNHRSSLKGLLKSQYLYGRGYGLLHKKYPQHFNPKYIITWKFIKVGFVTISYPIRVLRSLKVSERAYFLAIPLLDILTSLTYVTGTIMESYLSKEIPHEIIDKKLEFLKGKEIDSFSGLFKMVKGSLKARLNN
jgi:GT2 family glycosyltransferase